MENVCPSCSEQVKRTELKLDCSECKYNYHLLPCSGVSEATFISKGNALRKSWKCQTCKTAKSRGIQSAKEENAPEEIPNITVMLSAINAKLDSLMSLKETVGGIEKSMQEMSDKYEEVLREMKEHSKEMKQLKKRVERLERTDAEMEIKTLRQQVNDLEWRGRKLNLEFHGIPRTDNEDLLVKVNEIARKLAVPDLTMNEVAAVHRLPCKPDKTPGIIVRFVHQTTKDQWLNKRSALKKGKDNAYILENLTTHDRALLREAKEWSKETNYKYVWYRNGNVLVRKKERDQVHVIRSLDDLHKLA